MTPRDRLRRLGGVDWRVSFTVTIGVIAATLMVLLGMEPRLVLVAFVAAIVGAVTWLMVDLGPIASPLVWNDHVPDEAAIPRSDQRVRTLRTRLQRSARRRRGPTIARSVDTGRPEPVDEIVDALISVIDDHVEAEFGVDRTREPAEAAEILGPELTRFVTDPLLRRSMTDPRVLARWVGLIEDLCSRTPTSRRITR